MSAVEAFLYDPTWRPEKCFLKRMSKWTSLALELRDDPLIRQDEYRLLSGPAETDVTNRFAS